MEDFGADAVNHSVVSVLSKFAGVLGRCFGGLLVSAAFRLFWSVAAVLQRSNIPGQTLTTSVSATEAQECRRTETRNRGILSPKFSHPTISQFPLATSTASTRSII